MNNTYADMNTNNIDRSNKNADNSDNAYLISKSVDPSNNGSLNNKRSSVT